MAGRYEKTVLDRCREMNPPLCYKYQVDKCALQSKPACMLGKHWCYQCAKNNLPRQRHRAYTTNKGECTTRSKYFKLYPAQSTGARGDNDYDCDDEYNEDEEGVEEEDYEDDGDDVGEKLEKRQQINNNLEVQKLELKVATLESKMEHERHHHQVEIGLKEQELDLLRKEQNVSRAEHEVEIKRLEQLLQQKDLEVEKKHVALENEYRARTHELENRYQNAKRTLDEEKMEVMHKNRKIQQSMNGMGGGKGVPANPSIRGNTMLNGGGLGNNNPSTGANNILMGRQNGVIGNNNLSNRGNPMLIAGQNGGMGNNSSAAGSSRGNGMVMGGPNGGMNSVNGMMRTSRNGFGGAIGGNNSGNGMISAQPLFSNNGGMVGQNQVKEKFTRDELSKVNPNMSFDIPQIDLRSEIRKDMYRENKKNNLFNL